jgi:hypothetical protein
MSANSELLGVQGLAKTQVPPLMYPSRRANTRSLPIQYCHSQPGESPIERCWLNSPPKAAKTRDSIGDVCCVLPFQPKDTRIHRLCPDWLPTIILMLVALCLRVDARQKVPSQHQG